MDWGISAGMEGWRAELTQGRKGAKTQPNRARQTHRRGAMTAEKKQRQQARKILLDVRDSTELHCKGAKTQGEAKGI